MATAGYNGGNTTGFASPAGDYLEERLDVAEILCLRKPSRYLIRVSGDELALFGIFNDDLLVIDSAAKPYAGCIAIVMQDGETLVGELKQYQNSWWLTSSRENSPPRRLDAPDTEIWGRAVALIRTEIPGCRSSG